MKFDLTANPPPIVVKIGGEEFKLFHRFLTAIERAHALDAINRGLGAAMVEWWEYMLTWEGVFDMAGAPIPIMKLGTDGSVDRKNFDLVIGRLPFIEQVRIFLIQVAMNGIQIRRLRSVITELVSDEKEAEKFINELDPFFTKPDKTQPGEKSAA